MLFPDRANLPFLIEWGDGVNLPDDKSKINTQQLASVQLPYHPKLYTDTFALSNEGDIIQLENGKLLFTTDSELDFTLHETNQ